MPSSSENAFSPWRSYRWQMTSPSQVVWKRVPDASNSRRNCGELYISPL
jgi:hypothetical protein